MVQEERAVRVGEYRGHTLAALGALSFEASGIDQVSGTLGEADLAAVF